MASELEPESLGGGFGGNALLLIHRGLSFSVSVLGRGVVGEVLRLRRIEGQWSRLHGKGEHYCL